MPSEFECAASFCRHHGVWHRPGEICAAEASVVRVEWETLRAVRQERQGGVRRPRFDSALKRLDGRRVTLTGHMAPFQTEGPFIHFMFSDQPAECLCCPPGGPAEIVEVFAAWSLPFCHLPLRLTGRLRLLENDECGFFYQLEDAHADGQEAIFDATARAMERLLRNSTHDSAPWTAAPNVSRRGFLHGAAALAGGAAAWTAGSFAASMAHASAPAFDVRVGEVLKSAPAIDLHSHDGGLLSRSSRPRNVAQRMKEGRFAVVTMTAIADGPLIQKINGRPAIFRKPAPGELFAHVEKQLGEIEQMIRDQGFRKVLSPADLEGAFAAGQPALIVASEGADFLEGKLERVKWAYDRGLRHLQLVHYRVNELGDIQTLEPEHNGLTAFGVEVVKECNRLGIVVDVAHGTEAVVTKVAEVSKAPIVLSHGSVTREPRRLGRTVSLAHARLVTKTGGAVGVWPNGYMFGNLDTYLDVLVRHIQGLGADYVAIGSDMGGGIKEDFVFGDYAEFPALVDGLLKRDIAPEDVAKVMGGNHLRILRRVAEVAKAA